MSLLAPFFRMFLSFRLFFQAFLCNSLGRSRGRDGGCHNQSLIWSITSHEDMFDCQAYLAAREDCLYFSKVNSRQTRALVPHASLLVVVFQSHVYYRYTHTVHVKAEWEKDASMTGRTLFDNKMQRITFFLHLQGREEGKSLSEKAGEASRWEEIQALRHSLKWGFNAHYFSRFHCGLMWGALSRESVLFFLNLNLFNILVL